MNLKNITKQLFKWGAGKVELSNHDSEDLDSWEFSIKVDTENYSKSDEEGWFDDYVDEIDSGDVSPGDIGSVRINFGYDDWITLALKTNFHELPKEGYHRESKVVELYTSKGGDEVVTDIDVMRAFLQASLTMLDQVKARDDYVANQALKDYRRSDRYKASINKR